MLSDFKSCYELVSLPTTVLDIVYDVSKMSDDDYEILISAINTATDNVKDIVEDNGSIPLDELLDKFNAYYDRDSVKHYICEPNKDGLKTSISSDDDDGLYVSFYNARFIWRDEK